MSEKYSLGLDIGTNSIGWAVVDENNEIVKKNNFALWGVRMFEASSDASEKRSNRNSRRRLKRRKQRLLLLQNIFEEEIFKIDPTFFRRLEDSFYCEEDKKLNNHYNLFNDSYTDKDFYDKYPTIYHLRQHLLESSDKEDIRFIYLAMHHMIKYRGNFLYPGNKFKKNDISHLFYYFSMFNDALISLANKYEDVETYFETIDYEKDDFIISLEEIINGNYNKNEKKNKLLELFKVNKKSLVGELLIPLISGSKINISSISFVKDMGYDKVELQAIDEKYEEQVEEAKLTVTELIDIIDVLPFIKAIIDHFYLVKTLGENNVYISKAMVDIFESHKKDLVEFKELIKLYKKDKYNECFRKVDNKLFNYPSYIGMNNSGKMLRFKHAKKEDFYAYVKKLLDSITCSDALEIKNKILSKIENGTFLLRQNSNQNGAFPMQLNLLELEEILNKQSRHYSFLVNKDSEGYDNIQKIISIFKYKLPYYVGPLNKKSPYSWVVKSEGKIYPWNYKEVVDLDATAKEFIIRMQNKCTYLKGDKDYCLPKKSLLYSEFMCLQYLNKLNINGALINCELKNEIFREIFLKISKPTKNNIINFLKTKGYKDINEIPVVPCDMSSYVKFKEIFGEKFESNIDMIENIILDITIFEDKSILETRLRNLYNLDSDTVKKIKGLDYKGYGNLSKHLLGEFYTKNSETGEVYGTIIQIMRKTNYNLQQILFHEDYKFNDAIIEYNKEVLGEMDENYDYKDFIREHIYTSPIMKRALIQSYRIIEEVENILGKKIDKYYIECTRHESEKKIKKSRYDSIKELYKSCKDIALELNIDLNELNKNLDRFIDNKNALRSDKLYLYFTQFGKSMYSLKTIPFNSLFESNQVDIDHIYPQSLIKDDSLSNRVLVFKSENEAKLDKFTFEVPGLIDNKSYVFYKYLLDKGLISKEKYKRLTKKEIVAEELDGFVNRQLVATNQAVIGLINLLRSYKQVNNEDIIFSKAETISDFRNEFQLVKSRLANNYHHAHDAYLNVVVGRTIHKYYTINYFKGVNDYYRMKSEKKTINPMNILKYDRSYNGKKYWEPNKVLNIIKHNLYERFDIRETRRMYHSNTMFSKTQLIPGGSKNPLPIKTSDERLLNVNRYGGFPSPSYCKYVVVSTLNKKNKKEYILEPIPRTYKDKVSEYLSNVKKMSNFEILVEDVMTNVICEFQNRRFAITGVTNDSYYVINMKDRYFSKECINIIHKIEKYYDNKKKNFDMPIVNGELVLANSKEKVTLSHYELDKLCDVLKQMFNKEIYNFAEIINTICLKLEEKYTALSIDEKVVLLKELLSLCKTNERLSANLELLGEAKQAGIFKINKKLSSGMKLIYESLTAYYRKIIFEVPSIGI